MSEQERWQWLQEALTGIKSDIAVILSRLDRIESLQNDHESRIRNLERDVSNNKMIVRAAVMLATTVGGTGLAIAASVLKELIQ